MIDLRRVVTRVWEERSGGAVVARTLLAPLAAGYGAVTSIRNALYDRGALAVVQPAIAAVSVGNLSVGGTGKTPVAAWIVQLTLGHFRRRVPISDGFWLAGQFVVEVAVTYAMAVASWRVLEGPLNAFKERTPLLKVSSHGARTNTIP